MLAYQDDDDARRGGLDITISLTPDQAAAIGADAAELAEALDTLLVGLAALRTNHSPGPAPGHSLKDQPVEAGRVWTEWLLRDLTLLRARVAAMTSAAIRAHAEQGGSHGELAEAMHVSRSTAQRRRDTVRRNPPTAAERWATTLPKEE